MKTYRLLALATGLSGIGYFVSFSQQHVNAEQADTHSVESKKAIISVPPLYIPFTDDTQLTPAHTTNPQDTTEDKVALFRLKNNNIHHDEYGNNIVDISTDGFNSKEFIVSNAPIYYPTEEQLNNGVNGCGMGGYYVELNAHLSLIIKNDNGTSIYPYLCTHNTQDNTYAFMLTENAKSIEKTISTLLSTP